MTTYAVIDPSTDEQVAAYATVTGDELLGAVESVSAGYRMWSRLEIRQRAEIVKRVGELHVERADELARIITREMGKPFEEAVGEVEFSASIYAHFAANADRLLAGEDIILPEGSGTAVIRRESTGPLLGVMPWNYPYYQVARFAAPNLILGNTIVLKHASQCPESAAAIAQLISDAGAPEGAYVNIYASREQVAEIIADPRIQGVSLTGSEGAGSAVAEVAGRHLKKVVLELGGSDPFVLLSSDDLDQTVAAAVAGRLENTGQACNGAKRFIVADELYEEFLVRFVEALDSSWSGAPLSSVAAAATLRTQVERAVTQGATFHTRRAQVGAFFPPGVLTDVHPESDVYYEELFGPVAIVHRAEDEDMAIRIANDTQFGLGSYVFTTDADQAGRVSRALEAGMVYVNGVGLEGAELPFGGIKKSGFGRELGDLGIDEFANRKLIRHAY